MLSVIVPTRQEGGMLLRGLAALATVPDVDEAVVAAWGERATVRRRAERCPRLRWSSARTPGGARAAGPPGRPVRLPERARTSARRFTASGPWRQLAVNAAIVTLRGWGVPAATLARLCRP